MTSDKKLKLLLNTMIVTVLSLLLFLSSCPEEPDYYDDSDTTSHNFIWQIDTLGLYGSYLNDVWIVDENNIWVVGEINISDPDSSWNGTGIETFNAVHWNGTEWEYIHIRGSLMNDTGPLYSIWYFDDNDIWVSSGCPEHWDGTKWTLYHLWDMGILSNDDGGVYRIWASSPSNIYFVGYKGSIVHYDGKNFRKMESGTDSPIVDIWGINKDNIWAIAVTNIIDDNHPFGYEDIWFHFNGESWRRKYTASPGDKFVYSPTKLSGYLSPSVWAYRDTVYIPAFSGLWKESIKTGKGKLIHGYINSDFIMDGRLWKISGTSYNDIICMTIWGELFHYNGNGWAHITLLMEQFPEISLYNLSIRGNQLVLVGSLGSYSSAVIIRGHHVK
ncbi:MAG TPA: hypothetical protein PL107_06655 [Candidatus Marinimicrobia bacterium]|jgi:hypothetical protein|nr:hypothetical protein [Candidatus Neomarinimicrobiota bacterium]